MKKISVILLIILFAQTSFAQDLTNQFYFRLGYSSPSWTQYGMEKDDWGDDVSKTGATFELGSIFMINRILKADNMAIGINVDYLNITYGNFSYSESGYEENVGNVRIGSKIGPSFTYSPMDKMAIDVYAKANIEWGSAAVMYEDEVGDADDYYLGYGTVGFSTGLNFRYGLLILGMEFNSVSPKLESDEYPGEYIGHQNEDSDKSPLPCMNFTIGMSF